CRRARCADEPPHGRRAVVMVYLPFHSRAHICRHSSPFNTPTHRDPSGHMSAPAVEVIGLRKSFGPVVAVDDVSFSIPPGSVTALLGGNGAGKTTTISMLLGLIIPDAGRIGVLGVDM